MIYVCFVLNHAYNETIKTIPMNAATGSTCYVSPLIRFHFWNHFTSTFDSYESSFSSNSIEETGRFLGISENVVHAMIFSILKITTNKVISRSNVIPLGEPTSPNLIMYPLTTPEVVKSLHLPSNFLKDDKEAHDDAKTESPDSFTSPPKHAMPILDPNYIVSRTFLIVQEGGQHLRARIVKAIDDYKRDLQR